MVLYWHAVDTTYINMYKGLFGSITTFLDLQLWFYQSEEYVLKKVNNPKGVGNNSKSLGTSIKQE